MALTVIGAVFGILASNYGLEKVFPWIVLTIIVFGLILFGRWLIHGVMIAEESDPESPIKLDTFNDSYQAANLVARLEEVGINATAIGGFVSGFQAESPGYVDVVVPKSQFESAQNYLDQLSDELDD